RCVLSRPATPRARTRATSTSMRTTSSGRRRPAPRASASFLPDLLAESAVVLDRFAVAEVYCASNQRLQNRQMRDIFFIAVAKPLRCRESLLLMATRGQHQAP